MYRDLGGTSRSINTSVELPATSLLQGHGDHVRAVVFSPNGQTVISGSEDQTVKFWNVQTGKCFITLQGHNKAVWSIALSPDGQILASSSEDETVKLWDIATGECLRTLMSARPYEGINITGITGINDVTIASLKALGAFECKEE